MKLRRCLYIWKLLKYTQQPLVPPCLPPLTKPSARSTSSFCTTHISLLCRLFLAHRVIFAKEIDKLKQKLTARQHGQKFKQCSYLTDIHYDHAPYVLRMGRSTIIYVLFPPSPTEVRVHLHRALDFPAGTVPPSYEIRVRASPLESLECISRMRPKIWDYAALEWILCLVSIGPKDKITNERMVLSF